MARLHNSCSGVALNLLAHLFLRLAVLLNCVMGSIKRWYRQRPFQLLLVQSRNQNSTQVFVSILYSSHCRSEQTQTYILETVRAPFQTE